MHTMGPKALAILRHELQEKDPNKKPPSQADVYMNSRFRTTGGIYLKRNEDTQKNIKEKMQELKSLNDESGEKDPNFDPYHVVMTKKEHSGRLRLHGAGVTKNKLMKNDDKTPFIVPPVFLKGIAENMRKSITEEVQQNIAKQMDQQFSNLLSKFREANPGINNEVDDASSSHENLDGDYFEGN